MPKWVSIMEYSVTKGISPSTVRRKIKNKSLSYRLEKGKYLIYDENANNINKVKDTGDTPTLIKEPANLKTNPNVEEILAFSEKSISTMASLYQDISDEKDKRISLQDKMIKQLREEIVELRMLVNILEKKEPES